MSQRLVVRTVRAWVEAALLQLHINHARAEEYNGMLANGSRY